MSEIAQNLVISTLAREKMAGLKHLVKKCDDKAVLEEIYREVVQFATDLNRNHGFSLTEKAKTVKK